MEEHISPITLWVNHHLGPLVVALLNGLHIHPENTAMPIPEYVVMGMLVCLLVLILAIVLRMKLSVDNPGTMQQIAELLLTNPMRIGIRDVIEENSGHHALSYVPFVGSIAIFILFSNLFGLFPLFSAPTGKVTVPLACATLTFLYFNYQGMKAHGPLGYLRLFAGPVWWMSWLIFPVEIISTLARVLSLTVRLYANILSSDMITYLFLSLFSQGFVVVWSKSHGFGILMGILTATIPLVFIVLQIFVAIVQSFIFTVLPSVYLGLATSEEH